MNRPAFAAVILAAVLALSATTSSAASYVGDVRAIQRDGHVVIAVDQFEPDGVANLVVVVEVEQSITPFAGHALVEVTDAGVRIVALSGKLRTIATLDRPRAVQTREGAHVRVPLADVEGLDLETPSATGRRLLHAMLERFGPDPDIEKLRERFIANDEGGDRPRDCVGEGETERCEDPPVEEPGGGGGGGSDPGPGGGARKCEQPCLYGKCTVTCYYPATPICKCSENPRGYPLCACL